MTILSAEGESTHQVDMRPAPPIDGRYVSLGQFRFEANDQGYVQISNEGTTGHVTADAVLFIPADQLDRLAAGNRRWIAAARKALKALEAELETAQGRRPRPATWS